MISSQRDVLKYTIAYHHPRVRCIAKPQTPDYDREFVYFLVVGEASGVRGTRLDVLVGWGSGGDQLDCKCEGKGCTSWRKERWRVRLSRRIYISLLASSARRTIVDSFFVESAFLVKMGIFKAGSLVFAPSCLEISELVAEDHEGGRSIPQL